MKNISLFLIVFLPIIYCQFSIGQNTFNKVIEYHHGVYGDDIIEIENSGYMMVGYFYDTGDTSNFTRGVILCRTTYSGDTIWTKKFEANSIMRPRIIKESAGEIIIAFQNIINNTTVTLLKVNLSGNIFWSKGISGLFPPDNLEFTLDDQGNIIIVGDNLGILKTDPNGNFLWARHYNYSPPGNMGTPRTGVTCTSDGGYVAVGSANVGNGFNALIFKVDEFGNFLWSKAIKRSGYSDIKFYQVSETSSGDLLVSGSAYNQICLIKFSSNGTPIWNKVYYSTTGNQECIEMSQLDNGEILIAGSITPGSGFDENGLLIKLDSTGNVIWSNRFNMNNTQYNSLLSTSDNGIILTGSYRESITSKSMALLTKVDSIGNFNCENVIHSLQDTSITLYDSTNIVPGIRNGFSMNLSMNVIPSQIAEIHDACSQLNLINNSSSESLNIYPNPTDEELQINSSKKIEKISIYSTDLKLALTQDQLNTNLHKLNLSKLVPGIYFLLIETSEDQHVKKIQIK